MNIKYHFDDDRAYIRDWNVRIHAQFKTGERITNNGHTIRTDQIDRLRREFVESTVIFDVTIVLFSITLMI
jgi:hypothetical protein